MQIVVIRIIIVLRIDQAVFPDIGQAVRFRRIGPPVRALADVIMLVSAWRNLLLFRDGIRTFRKQLVRIGDQLPVGGEEFRIPSVEGMLDPGQDRPVQFDQRTFALLLGEEREGRSQEG